jgi:uncharacterized protein YbjQ (UPF0145 family)/DNA-directed RNA polymerase subunit M/transcription elongation factor TFIIS
MLKFNCPQCKHLLAAQERHEGTEKICPNCHKSIRIPAGCNKESDKLVTNDSGAEAILTGKTEIINDTVCPTCGEKIGEATETMFKSPNLQLSAKHNMLINEYHSEKKEYRCNKCGDGLYTVAHSAMTAELHSLKLEFEKVIPVIPIVSIHSPAKWDYLVCDIITAQTTTGTGVFSEIESSFADMFGLQSTTYNSKLKKGENMCKSLLRQEAIKLGANAVVAADIDYASLGVGKGMLMVCMTGTAVVVKNVEIFGDSFRNNMQRLLEIRERIVYLSQFNCEMPLYRKQGV